jgi:hypothetical protein
MGRLILQITPKNKNTNPIKVQEVNFRKDAIPSKSWLGFFGDFAFALTVSATSVSLKIN